jgi:hypothetical protein
MRLVLKNSNEAPGQAGKDLGVMIAFDDSIAAERAEGFLQLLEQSLKQESGRLLHQWWSHEVLAFTLMRELAALEAASADLIIIAIRDAPDLDETVAAWLHRSLDLRQGRAGTLVVLLDSDLNHPDASQGLLCQLKQAAAAGRMDFFAAAARAGMNQGAALVAGGIAAATRQGAREPNATALLRA